MPSQLEDSPDFAEIARRLQDGTIVPFFGAGASIACGLPSAGRLAECLVAASGFPDAERQADLAHVASFCAQTKDDVTLNGAIRQAFEVQAQPSRLHHLLTSTRALASRLFVTTNYDTLVEDALAPRAPWVVVDRGSPGLVYCRAPGARAWEEVESKKLGYTITDPERPVVLKLHGHYDREDRDNDSYLITEEHYVDFLGRGGDDMPIPHALALKMRQRSFLFLGYGLRDWNVRVLLHKLAKSRPRSGRIQSWAVVRQPSTGERALWKAQGVHMHDIDLDEFARRLEEHL
jgi:SIR2-like domain